MENPSLRDERTRQQHEQIIFVEDYAEGEFGQWTKDEVTGEQGYVGDERSCFLDMERH